MRSAPVILVVALAAGCGARSSLPQPEDGTPTADGGTHPGKIILTQGAVSQPVTPIDGEADVVSFYAYKSSSAHTGFEALGQSELFFYRDVTTGTVSLVTEHGIDIDSSGAAQPPSKVNQQFTGLPPGVTIAVADDSNDQFFLDTPTSAQGKWTFNQNTDGGVLSGFPLPGSWSVQITAEFLEGIDAWRFIDAEAPIPLDMTAPVTLTAVE